MRVTPVGYLRSLHMYGESHDAILTALKQNLQRCAEGLLL